MACSCFFGKVFDFVSTIFVILDSNFSCAVMALTISNFECDTVIIIITRLAFLVSCWHNKLCRKSSSRFIYPFSISTRLLCSCLGKVIFEGTNLFSPYEIKYLLILHKRKNSSSQSLSSWLFSSFNISSISSCDCTSCALVVRFKSVSLSSISNSCRLACSSVSSFCFPIS